MLDYTGISCPYCDEKFKEGDDIVVCPECGAPHHRNCWGTEDKCHFSALHSDIFEWKRPEIAAKEEKNTEDQKNNTETITCVACGEENEKDKLFCQKCGTPMNAGNMQGQVQPNQEVFVLGDPLGGVPKEELIDGITAGELGKFIGSRSFYFVRMFRHFFMRGTKISFNFFACIFNGLWFLSKKMYLIGGLVCAGMLAISIGQLCINYFYLSPALESLGTDYSFAEASRALVANVSPYIMMFFSALSFLQYGIMIACGILANGLYMNHCTKTIRSISATGETREVAFAQKGGTNLMLAVSLYICYTIFNQFGYLILNTLFQ